MNYRIEPGKIQELTVVAINDEGVFVGSEDYAIPLNRRESRGKAEGQVLPVFVYYNENREMEATTRLPHIQVGEVGMFRVESVNELGAFINIGSVRDVLLPKREQRYEMEAGKRALIMLCFDERNMRLFATTKIFSHLKNKPEGIDRGDQVEIMIAERIDVGRKVIVNGKFPGVIFNQEIMSKVHEGEVVKGYVRKIEGKDVIVSMQKEGMDLIDDATQRLLEYVEANGGYVRLNDDSDPEEIKLRLRMSKKTFKKAAGQLYKMGKVDLMKFGIKLLKDGQAQQDRNLDKWNSEDEADTRRRSEDARNEDSRERRPRNTAPAKRGPVRNQDYMKNEKRKAERAEREERGENEELTVRYASGREERPQRRSSSDRPSRSSSDRPSRSSDRPSRSSDRPSRSSDRPSRSSDRPSRSSSSRGSSSNTSRPGASGNSKGRRQSSPRSGRSPRNDR